MQNDPGTYLLWLRAEEAQTLEVGALGAMDVVPGVYAYVGSAFGPGGVRARVERHARGDGARHWHVDYLRAETSLEAVWFTHDDTRRECDWTRGLRALPGASVPMPGFGASDCSCDAHLLRFDDPPTLSAVRPRLPAGEDIVDGPLPIG